MNTKLTLTIQKSVIEKAKKYASDKESSLSDLVENYLIALTRESPAQEKKLTPIVQTLKGSVKMPKDFDYKEALATNLSDKYL